MSTLIFTGSGMARHGVTAAYAVPDHYRQRLADAAGRGFISTRHCSASRRVIRGILARGFRRPELSYSGDGEVQIRAYYGHHRITRTFVIANGILPDQLILAGLRRTADRMDAKRPGALKKTRRRRVAAPAVGHPIYVFHNNEQPKLDELVAMLPPEGGMAAYLKDMGAANDHGLVD
jgi:hypothetical protein